ncbi:MAG: aromatic ring-hydroxylating dioxygenase subunit alpha [Pigmentiphaga sp.]|nr:aromatic ring-hydroxylating dioxygenase subunit alpha [Pigmentiphaga sp.]
MNSSPRTSAAPAQPLLDDRPEDGVFRVHRSAFLDPRVFEMEQTRIFEGGWVFVGLASQLSKPHDFVTTTIGRQPILLMADEHGHMGAFFNSCRHRGMLLQPAPHGNRRVHVCRYHSWAYDSAGLNQHISEREQGRYLPGFQAEDHGLVPLPRFARYRDFLFASINPDVPELEDYLGEASHFLDLMSAQAPQGLEFLPGKVTYTFRGNWKLQIENALDMYHFSHVHVSYVELLKKRPLLPEMGGPPPTGAAEGEQGSFSFGNGHAVMWRSRSRASETLLAQRRERFAPHMSDAQLKWSGYGRNLTIFPNMQMVDNVTSMMLRVIHPLAPDLTEMRTYCLAPLGESPEEREARLRDYEDFFNPSGFATPDDNVVYEHSQDGLGAIGAGWTQGYARGMDRSDLPARNPYQDELGLNEAAWTVGPRSLGDETCFHDAYRTWARLLAG